MRIFVTTHAQFENILQSGAPLQHNKNVSTIAYKGKVFTKCADSLETLSPCNKRLVRTKIILIAIATLGLAFISKRFRDSSRLAFSGKQIYNIYVEQNLLQHILKSGTVSPTLSYFVEQALSLEKKIAALTLLRLKTCINIINTHREVYQEPVNKLYGLGPVEHQATDSILGFFDFRIDNYEDVKILAEFSPLLLEERVSFDKIADLITKKLKSTSFDSALKKNSISISASEMEALNQFPLLAKQKVWAKSNNDLKTQETVNKSIYWASRLVAAKNRISKLEETLLFYLIHFETWRRKLPLAAFDSEALFQSVLNIFDFEPKFTAAATQRILGLLNLPVLSAPNIRMALTEELGYTQLSDIPRTLPTVSDQEIKAILNKV